MIAALGRACNVCNSWLPKLKELLLLEYLFILRHLSAKPCGVART